MIRPLFQLIKNNLPFPVQSFASGLARKARFNGLSANDIFETVYRERYWGSDADGMPLSGTGSHDSRIVEPYVKNVGAFLESINRPTVVDMGCGDFNVGRHLVDQTSHYLACDISQTIIEINKKRYADGKQQFKKFNLLTDPLPQADVSLVRQVLQHLSNKDISTFVNKLHAESPCRYLIVTEHVADYRGVRMNRDKPTGPGTRVNRHSGVALELPPFNLQFLNRQELCSITQDMSGVSGKIVTTLFTLRQTSWCPLGEQ